MINCFLINYCQCLFRCFVCATYSSTWLRFSCCLSSPVSLNFELMRFLVSTDSNLVLYDGQTAIWSNKMVDKNIVRTRMQKDGNLVSYDGHGVAKWASNTDGNDSARLVVQDDGNMVIYNVRGNAIWATNTAVRYD